MQDNSRSPILKYSLLIVVMFAFVLLYVWQNIEVMKINIECRKLVAQQKKIIHDNDRIVFEIEKYKRGDYIEFFAEHNNYQRITPNDFGVIEVK